MEDVEQRLLDGHSPSWLAPRQLERRDPQPPERLIRRRQRLLTLPVIVAITVSLVWRRMPSLADVQKLLARDGVLGVAPLQVSPQALIKRLDGLPAAVLGPLLAEVCARVQAQAPPLNQSTGDWYTHAAIFACCSAAIFSIASVTAGS